MTSQDLLDDITDYFDRMVMLINNCTIGYYEKLLKGNIGMVLMVLISWGHLKPIDKGTNHHLLDHVINISIAIRDREVLQNVPDAFQDLVDVINPACHICVWILITEPNISREEAPDFFWGWYNTPCPGVLWCDFISWLVWILN